MFKKNLGVDVKIEGKEWKSYIDMYKQSDFQIAYMGWGGSTLDPAAQLEIYAGDGPNNYAKWFNKDFDNLINQAKLEQDENKRFDLLHQAEDIMFTEYPLIPLVFPTDSYLQKSSVSGLEYYVGSQPSLRYAKKKKEVGNCLLFILFLFIFFSFHQRRQLLNQIFDSLYQV